jgi:hypothetical protein
VVTVMNFYRCAYEFYSQIAQIIMSIPLASSWQRFKCSLSIWLSSYAFFYNNTVPQSSVLGACISICNVRLKKLSEVEGKERYHVEISNRFAALEHLDTAGDVNKAWDTIRENIVMCRSLIRRVLVRMIGFIIRWLHTHS